MTGHRLQCTWRWVAIEKSEQKASETIKDRSSATPKYGKFSRVEAVEVLQPMVRLRAMQKMIITIREMCVTMYGYGCASPGQCRRCQYTDTRSPVKLSHLPNGRGGVQQINSDHKWRHWHLPPAQRDGMQVG